MIEDGKPYQIWSTHPQKPLERRRENFDHEIETAVRKMLYWATQIENKQHSAYDMKWMGHSDEQIQREENQKRREREYFERELKNLQGLLSELGEHIEKLNPKKTERLSLEESIRAALYNEMPDAKLCEVNVCDPRHGQQACLVVVSIPSFTPHPGKPEVRRIWLYASLNQDQPYQEDAWISSFQAKISEIAEAWNEAHDKYRLSL